MFTVTIQTTTKSGIVLSTSFASKDEADLKSKTDEVIALVQPKIEKKDSRQLELPLTAPEGHSMTPEPSTKEADTTLKIGETLEKESSIDGVGVSKLDKDGRPWDDRIDGPLKTFDRWGRWKAKTGVNKTDRIRIIEELKAGIAPEPQPSPALESENSSPQVEETNQVEVPATTEPVSEVVHMTLEHFTNNFVSVMAKLYDEKKLSDEKVKDLCAIARVEQAWQIPHTEESLKAVYNNLVQGGII